MKIEILQSKKHEWLKDPIHKNKLLIEVHHVESVIVENEIVGGVVIVVMIGFASKESKFCCYYQGRCPM